MANILIARVDIRRFCGFRRGGGGGGLGVLVMSARREPRTVTIVTTKI